MKIKRKVFTRALFADAGVAARYPNTPHTSPLPTYGVFTRHFLPPAGVSPLLPPRQRDDRADVSLGHQVHPAAPAASRHLRHHLRGVALSLRPLLGREPRRNMEAGGYEHGAGQAHQVMRVVLVLLLLFLLLLILAG